VALDLANSQVVARLRGTKRVSLSASCRPSALARRVSRGKFETVGRSTADRGRATDTHVDLVDCLGAGQSDDHLGILGASRLEHLTDTLAAAALQPRPARCKAQLDEVSFESSQG